MKIRSSIGSALILAVALSASAAQAKVKVSQLTSVNLDPKISKYDPNSQVMGGQITVDTTKKTAGLAIFKTARCRPMLPCPKYFINVLNETLTIVSVEKLRACGETVITAKVDKSIVDGPSKELIITDNSTFDRNRCKTNVAVMPLTAEYKTAFRSRTGLVTTESTFVGELLK